jgi:serpin B
MRLPLLSAPLLLALVTACAASEPAKRPAPPLAAEPPQAASEASPAPAPSSTTAPAPSAPETPATPAATTSVNELTVTLLRALESEKGNVFYSATSLRTALGMTALGARGKTLDELNRAMYLAPDPAANAAAAKREGEEWKRAAGKAELNIANRLFAQRGLTLASEFTARTESGYGASTGLVDFVAAPEASRKEINRWVSDRTKRRIPELLPEGSIDELTRLVLTNAIYFKGTWLEKFDKARTQNEPFQAPTGTVSVPTMHRASQMSYGERDDVRLVDLPYEDSDLAMLIALPTESTTLTAVVQGLTPEKLEAWTGSLQNREVRLALPKLEFSWGRSVKKELIELGIQAAFKDKVADFGAMVASGQSELLIDDVFHKGFVLVDEVGTEAAAATGVVMRTKSLPPRPVELKVDRPFLFFIRNTKTGDVLFAGRVVNPKEKG